MCFFLDRRIDYTPWGWRWWVVQKQMAAVLLCTCICSCRPAPPCFQRCPGWWILTPAGLCWGCSFQLKHSSLIVQSWCTLTFLLLFKRAFSKACSAQFRPLNWWVTYWPKQDKVWFLHIFLFILSVLWCTKLYAIV